VRLLLVEDDADLSQRLQNALRREGYSVDLAPDGIEGQYLGEVEPYDAVVLDLGLPKRPGLEVLGNWRAAQITTPVLILTARDAWHERVDGFKAGADDYLGKPFHIEELLVRLQALIRRSQGASGPVLEVAGLSLDEDRRLVMHPQKGEIELTGTEFRLLRYFMLNPDRVLSKTRLTEHVYEGDFDRDSNLIEVYVRRLRDKLGKGHIETLRGQGYRFPRHTA
jgi:DNA-binding response OmpR family regulator